MNINGEWTNPGDWISCLFTSQLSSGKLNLSNIRTRKKNQRKNGIDHHSDDGSPEPPEKKDEHHNDDDYIEFCFRKDGEFEVVNDNSPQPAIEITKENQSKSKRSDQRSSTSSGGSFSFPVLEWGEMVGSPVRMPKAKEEEEEEEEFQVRKQRNSCWKF
ncbi:hypothetical protein LINGRAHAP2_LOCUS11602 [Linum grandiflorum]